MIPEKIDSISINTIRVKSVNSIVDWFNQHKRSFYTLGWSYLRNQQQMEELFYRSIIKVRKEFPRFKGETSFDTWVTSIFIHICRELSSDRSLQDSEETESSQNIFKALNQMKEYEKEAVVLTYIKGISKEDTARMLQVSVEKMKEHLFSGIQFLREYLDYGSSFNGCKEYRKIYIDYLERNLERSKKVDFETHIYHCQDCQEDLGTFQEVMLTMLNLTERMEDFYVPSDFMENVKARLAEMEKQRQQKVKKRIRVGVVIASVFAVLIGLEVISGAFTNTYYSWTEENQELRSFLKEGLGERLNLEAESDGVKIKIKSAIADNVQTLVFYEIEDTNKDNQYMIDFYEGVFVENEYEIMIPETAPRYFPPDLKLDVNNKEKNVYRGKISLLPLATDNGTIKLKITKLLKVTSDSSGKKSFNPYENADYEFGNWSFEIPVTKQPSSEYALDGEMEVEGVPVRFDKLTIAPTATTLQYSFQNEQHRNRIDVLNIDYLEVNNKKVKANINGTSFLHPSMDWLTLQTQFDPIYGEKPKKVNIKFKSAQLTIEAPLTFMMNDSVGYPQTFEYAGSTISIDKVEVGQPTNIVISNHEIKNRAFQHLIFNIVGEDEHSSMGMNTEGVFVDKNGVEYDMNALNPFSFEEMGQLRYFFTVQNIELYSNDSKQNAIPNRMEITGYTTTKYLDDIVKVSLKK